MASGDVVSDITTIAAAASMNYQPAAGVETVITECMSASKATDMAVQTSNGTIGAYSGADSARWQGKMFVNNTLYLRIFNNNASSLALSFTGVQVK